MEWLIGCSGFSNKDWKGVFYPAKLPNSKWLAFYSQHFEALEVNTSFYRFPTQKLFQSWYAKTPMPYCFSVKVPRLITHFKQMTDTEGLLSNFYETCYEGLAEKLGPVLFQFGPRFEYAEDRLNKILSQLDTKFTNVVEFRHASWWRDEVFVRLGEANILFCGISYPNLPCNVVANSSSVYYRFHGIQKIYYSSYGTDELKQFADSILNQQNIQTVFCFFNNTATDAAINNAGFLKEYVLGRTAQ